MKKKQSFFSVGFEAPLNLSAQPSQRGVIYYKNLEFANIWLNNTSYDWPGKEGKWEFNRSSVAILNKYWPEKYLFDSVEEMIAHLEETFSEIAK